MSAKNSSVFKAVTGAAFGCMLVAMPALAQNAVSGDLMVSDVATPGRVSMPPEMTTMPAPVQMPPLDKQEPLFNEPIPAKQGSVLGNGQMAPQFDLMSAKGGYVALKDILEKGPALVMFTRGTAAPYSLQQMQMLQKNHAKLQQLNIQVVVISPEPLDALQRAQNKFKFDFHLLNDGRNEIARQYDVLQITEPTPALFSISKTGKVVAVQLQPQMKMPFDLNEATVLLRPIPAPIAAPEHAKPVSPATPGAAAEPVVPVVPSPQSAKSPVVAPEARI